MVDRHHDRFVEATKGVTLDKPKMGASFCGRGVYVQYCVALIISNLNVLMLLGAFVRMCLQGGDMLRDGEGRCKYRWVPYAASTAVFFVTLLLPLLGLTSPIKELCPVFFDRASCSRPSNRMSTCQLIDFGHWPERTAASSSGEPLGMPSGHSAVAGAFAVVMAFTASTFATTQALGAITLAVLTALSRMYLRCHTLWQVLLGAALGAALGLGNCGVLRQL